MAGAWFVVVCVGLSLSAQAAENWPRFRGLNGAGHSTLKGLPVAWTVNDYEWTIALPGTGHSSPVVWGDRVFVTSSLDDGRRTLHGLNAETGAQVWEHSVSLAQNHLHKFNSYASGSPVVDEERVYVCFADADHYLVQAFTHDGQPAWSRDLGPCLTEHGHGVSPIVVDNLLIISNDQAKPENELAPPSAIMALDRRTGEDVWHSPRPSRDASYATPVIYSPAGASPVLICLSGAAGVSAVDLMTGQSLWSTEPMPLRTVGSPVVIGGLVFATCGQGGRGQHLVCVDPASLGGDGRPQVRYTRTKGLPYVPTPVGDESQAYLWNDDGTVFCIDVATGEDRWTGRVGGSFYCSPLLIDGKLYCVSHEGEVVVLATGPEFQVLGRSPLGDSSYSTPAVGHGRLFIRGFKKLACLKARG